MSLKESASILLRMWGFAKRWKVQFYLSFLLGSTAPLYFSYVISYITKTFTAVCVSGEISNLQEALISVGLIILFGIVFYPIIFGMIYITYSKIAGIVKKEIFKHAEELPVSYIENAYSGDLASRITTDFNHAIQLVAYPVVGQGNPFALVFTMIAIGIIILCSHFTLGIISLILGFANLCVINLLVKPLRKREGIVKEKSAEAAQGIVNSLSGTMVSRIFGLHTYLQKEYEEKTKEIFQNNVSLIRKKSVLYMLTSLQGFIAFAGVTGIGLFLASKDIVDIPTVIFISTMQMSLSQDVSELSKKFAEMQKYIVGAKRLFEYLDAPIEVQRENKKEPDKMTEDIIEIENLEFAYEEGTKIFDGMDLKIKTGERLAIVGGSGGGKSTLFKLLLEFANKQKGEIKVFGNNTEEYSQKNLRSLFSYVPQDCYLFDSTIEENVRMGKPTATKEEVEKALEDAYIKDFIDNLPEGIQTRVGERGSKLSGGQRQRIAIARAFLKNAPIILLDEATSALDSESEEAVQKALDHLMLGRTSIVIAHRLSTIQNMDRILVLEKGHIIEEGSHQALLEEKGRYAKLYEMQFAGASEYY